MAASNAYPFFPYCRVHMYVSVHTITIMGFTFVAVAHTFQYVSVCECACVSTD